MYYLRMLSSAHKTCDQQAGLHNTDIHHTNHIDNHTANKWKLTRMAINLASGLHTACKFSPSVRNESESLLYFPSLTLF